MPSSLSEEPPIRQDAVSGGGCSPGGSNLDDGWWYGTLAGDVTDEVPFDLACFYSGAAAEEVAAERDDEVANDYYVVDDSAQVRQVPLADDVTATCVDLGDGVQMVACDLSELDGEWAVWLRVVGGRVDRIVEQYVP